MQIELQSNQLFMYFLNTLGAELKVPIPIQPERNIYGILIRLTGFDLLPFFSLLLEMSVMEKLLSKIIFTRCLNIGFCKESEFEVTEQTENSATFSIKSK